MFWTVCGSILLAQPYARQLYSVLPDAEDIYIDTTFYTADTQSQKVIQLKLDQFPSHRKPGRRAVPVALFPYSDPVMVSSEVPGSTVNTPVAASWVNVAAGTVSAPTTVANVPVVSS